MPRNKATEYPKKYVGIVFHEGKEYRTEVYACTTNAWHARGQIWAQLLGEKFTIKLRRMIMLNGKRIYDEIDVKWTTKIMPHTRKKKDE